MSSIRSRWAVCPRSPTFDPEPRERDDHDDSNTALRAALILAEVFGEESYLRPVSRSALFAAARICSSGFARRRTGQAPAEDSWRGSEDAGKQTVIGWIEEP
jgi:hypothetical protein